MPSPNANQPWTRLSSEDLAAIQQKIAWCEQRTDGEIVVTLCRRSTWPSSSFNSFTISLTIIAYLFGLLVFIYGGIEPLAFTLLLPSTFGISHFLSAILDRFKIAERSLLNRNDIIRDTSNRAELEFYRRIAHKTKRSTGLLIFLSYIERKVVVLADESISKRLSDNSCWDQMVQTIIDGMRSGQIAKGIIDALDIGIQPLQQHFPPLAHNSNELTDHVVILHDDP